MKFHGRTEVSAKYKPRYPSSAERECIRLTDDIMALEKKVLIRYLPKIKKIISRKPAGFNADSQDAAENEKTRKQQRLRDIDEAITALNEVFRQMGHSLEMELGLYNIHRKLDSLSNLTRKLTVCEWKKSINKTLGINILEDYYSGDYYSQMLKAWISDNVGLIKTLPSESLDRMKQQLYSDYINGKPLTSMVKEMQAQYGMDKRHAQMVARDQIGKLNSSITKSQHADAGVTRYQWSTSRDSRVRDCHRSFEGKVFSWKDPPEIFYVTKKGIKYTGRRCHPGEDYQCGCVALPVFDFESLDLPVDGFIQIGGGDLAIKQGKKA